jgi:NAD(P)-dependent dehydrogenase (short-subunit alcohol dehydrogenase family)
MKLENRVALVTGGSRSIGRAIALGFAREGADIAVNYISNAKEAKNTVREIEALGRRAVEIRADTSKRAEVDAMVDEAWKQLGPIDILVNNAGIVKRIYFLDLEEKDWDRMLGVNLKGCYLVGQAVAARMKTLGHGTIINVSSAAAGSPAQRMTAYCVSKAGVTMLTKCMALELAQYGIRVNALSPGLTLTDINRKDLEDEKFLKARLERIPLGKVMNPEDLVGAALFLASSESQMATGITVQVDGGTSIA